MPYIKPEQRKHIIITDIEHDDFLYVNPEWIDCAGDLNFTFTWLIKRYIEKKGLCYQTMNDIMGALTGCQLELYRTTTGPLEETKIKENGDVE